MTTRFIDCEFEIDAPIEDVWAAITEAEHICRWFAPFVEGRTGESGYIDLSWLDPNSPMRLDITGWDPMKRLQTTWHSAPHGETPINLPLDIQLVVAGEGRTQLKLVQSGFLSDESWDDEFMSHSRGWNTELRHLKYYVEHHFNQVRQYIFEKLPLDETMSGIAAMVGPHAPVRADVQNLSEGESFSLQMPDGTRWECRLLWQFATTDLVFVCDALDGGIVRLAVETMSGSPELWLWAFSWAIPEDEIAKRVRPLLAAVQEKMEMAS